MSQNPCVVCKIVGIIVAIGAINLGLMAFFQLDLVAKFLGTMTTPAKIAYGLIGIAGVMKILSLAKACPCQRKAACGTK